MTKYENFFNESEILPKKKPGKHYVERRKYPRFNPCSEIFILHSIIGSVIDISISGLACTYFNWKDNSKEIVPKRGTIFSVEEHYLEGIPLVVVSDDVVQQSSNPILPEIKKRRILFSGLTEEQLERLELFLLANVNVPDVSDEEQKKFRRIATAKNFSSV